MKHEEDWWLGGFLVGFIVGAILGFTYTRLVPLSPYITPAQLGSEDKELYLVLIGAAYRYDADLDKVQRRLDLLEIDDIEETITDLSQIYIDQGADIRDIRSLAILASSLALPIASDSLLAYLPTPTQAQSPVRLATSTTTLSIATATNSTAQAVEITPTAASTATQTPTPPQSPTSNPTITARITNTPGPNAPFGLAQSVALCDNSANGVLRIYVRDRFGTGIPGTQLEVRWANGQDKLFTGIKSATNPGYADFQMRQDQIYQIELLGLSSTIATQINQAADDRCPNMPEDQTPSWQVVFQQGVSP